MHRRLRAWLSCRPQKVAWDGDRGELSFGGVASAVTSGRARQRLLFLSRKNGGNFFFFFGCSVLLLKVRKTAGVLDFNIDSC